jgi:4-amino-4-deoxy-L-arabinose transferase-like glycosyltransferase
MVSVATLSEGLFIALVLGAIACTLAFLRSEDRWMWVVAAGALAGAAALTRTNGLVLLVPLLLAVPARRRLLLLAVAALVIAPWTIRSSSELDSFIPTTTQAGFALAGVYNDEARDDDDYPAAWRVPVMAPYDQILRTARDKDEDELEREFRSEALGYIADHPLYPGRVVYWSTVRMLNLADPEVEKFSAREASVGTTYAKFNRWSTWLLVAVAVAGAFTAAARAAPRWLWLTPVLLWLSIAIVIGATRYRTPVDPFLILLAALAIVRWRPTPST